MSAAAWAVLPGRIAWLRRFRRLLATHRQGLCDLVFEDVGKPKFEALTTDLLPLLTSCRWHERHARRLLKPRRLRGAGLLAPGQRHWTCRVPVGRVAIIATWNYPLQLLGIQLLQALLAGNRVVVKPSERSPRCQLRLLELAREAGLPDGMLTWTAATREAGPELLASGGFDHVVFTGSTAVGRQVAAWAAERLIPTTLELSGRDSALVLADADVSLAARSIWHAVTMNAGQTCMAPRRVLVERACYDKFVAALAPLAAAAAPRRVIDAAAAKRCFALAREAVEAGGRSISAVIEPPREDSFRPLAIIDCPPDCELVEGDHFGPVVAVVPVDSLEQALLHHNACAQHLATSVFTADTRRAKALAVVLRSGWVTINDVVLPTVHPAAGIVGTGESGWGASRGASGLLALTREVTISTTSRRVRLPVSEPAAKMVSQFSRLIGWLHGADKPPEASVQRPSACRSLRVPVRQQQRSESGATVTP